MTLVTLAYWKQFFYQLVVKQLKIPTYFLIFSCADLRWDELPHTINKLNNLNLTDKEIRTEWLFSDNCVSSSKGNHFDKWLLLKSDFKRAVCFAVDICEKFVTHHTQKPQVKIVADYFHS